MSRGQVPAQQEAAVNPFPTEQLKMLKEIQETMDKRVLGFEEHTKERNEKLSDRFQALGLKQQGSPAGNAGSQKEKSEERDNHATEAGGQDITPPE